MKKNQPKFVLLSLVWFLTVWYFPVRNTHAQEDAYHTWLRNHLQSEYSVTGGDWVISDTETATLNKAWAPADVKKEEIAVNDQPFTKAFRLTTSTRPANFWDYSIQFSAQNAIANGDVLLVIVSVRGVSGERGRGLINHTYELGQSPYTGMLAQRQAPTADWQQWMIPIQVTADLPTSWYKINLGFQAIVVEIGGVAVLNFGDAYTVEDLPKSTFHLDYEGRDLGAAWRAQAQARIEAHRKADLRIRVLDDAGQPVQGAEVKMNLQRHAFGFGTAMIGPEKSAHQHNLSSEELEPYYNSFENLNGNGHSFNWAVIGDALRWATWEKPYWPPWQQSDGQSHTLNFFDWLHERKVEVRGHMLVWPAFKWLPPDIEEHKNDPAYIRQRIADHIRSIVGHPRLKGRVVDWTVINEPAHLTDLEDVFGGVEEYADWFKIAAEADPNAKLLINEYEVLSAGGMNITIKERYKEIIQIIEANGGRIDGVGLQGHVGYPLAPPELLYEIIDEYAALGNGKEISISEYDAKGVEEVIGGDYMRDILTIAFSHSAVNSFMIWGYWDRNHWRDDAPVFRDDWSMKPSGETFIDLVFNQWWTDAQAQTDAQGEATAPGFLGDYKITASFNGMTGAESFTLSKDSEILEITLDNATSIVENETLPKEFALGQNYPNPFNPTTTISYELPQAGFVTLKVSDMLGREVATLVQDKKSAGTHKVAFDASSLASGVYLYRLQVGGFQTVRKMILAR